jgi:Fcf2 pre-rRNA processing
MPIRDARKEARAAARSKTASAGAGWFDMKAQTITPEVKRDWRLLRLRSAYNPRHFYKARHVLHSVSFAVNKVARSVDAQSVYLCLEKDQWMLQNAVARLLAPRLNVSDL